jgi:hypothetical protein
MDDEAEPDDRPRRRRRRPPPDDFDTNELLVPAGSTYAIIALYVGLIGLCLPLVGIVFAVPAFVCGIVAVRRWKKADSYGGVTSNIRAVLGLVISGAAVLLWGTVAVMIALKQ